MASELSVPGIGTTASSVPGELGSRGPPGRTDSRPGSGVGPGLGSGRRVPSGSTDPTGRTGAGPGACGGWAGPGIWKTLAAASRSDGIRDSFACTADGPCNPGARRPDPCDGGMVKGATDTGHWPRERSPRDRAAPSAEQWSPSYPTY